MNFKQILRLAKKGNETAIEFLLDLYHPLLLRMAKIDGVMDEDLYQNLCITFFRCIRMFRIP